MVLLLVSVALGACKPTASNAPGKKLDVTVMRASYADDSDAPGEVVFKCKFEEKVAEAVVENTPGSSLSSGGGSAKVLSLEIVSMRGADPSWQGERSVIVRGRLEDGGVAIGTFRIKRASEPGQLMGGMMGVCSSLDDVAEMMGESISDWLQDPEMNSELEE